MGSPVSCFIVLVLMIFIVSMDILCFIFLPKFFVMRKYYIEEEKKRNNRTKKKSSNHNTTDNLKYNNNNKNSKQNVEPGLMFSILETNSDNLFFKDDPHTIKELNNKIHELTMSERQSLLQYITNVTSIQQSNEEKRKKLMQKIK